MITPENLYEKAAACAKVVQKASALRPEVGIILGTGLGGLAKEIDIDVALPYDELPDFPVSTVESHSGRLILGHLNGTPVVAMEGRFHLYEGYSPLQLTFPVRVMKLMGISTLYVSNAAGGMNPRFRKGELMIITDHINFLGANPLIGKNDERFGPRFPDMSEPFSERLAQKAQSLALELKIPVERGVYVAVAGPNLESKAEYRFLRGIGADAVGMSTVPEVLVARHMGMEVFAMSVITDMCLPDHLEEAKLEDIIAIAREAEPKLTRLLTELIGDGTGNRSSGKDKDKGKKKKDKGKKKK